MLFEGSDSNCALNSQTESMTGNYDWERYWVPREGSIAFDNRGFLVAPRTTENPHYFNSGDVVGLDGISSHPCLALHGEPGIGKSIAVNRARASQEALAAVNGERDCS
jgi:hypothetical protein